MNCFMRKRESFLFHSPGMNGSDCESFVQRDEKVSAVELSILMLQSGCTHGLSRVFDIQRLQEDWFAAKVQHEHGFDRSNSPPVRYERMHGKFELSKRVGESRFSSSNKCMTRAVTLDMPESARPTWKCIHHSVLCTYTYTVHLPYRLTYPLECKGEIPHGKANTLQKTLH